MPTIAESMYQDFRERFERYVADFVNSKEGSIDDSVPCLSARLYGLGFRGNELKAEVSLALMAQKEKRMKVCTIYRVDADPDVRGYYAVHYRFGEDGVGCMQLRAINAKEAQKRFMELGNFDIYRVED